MTKIHNTTHIMNTHLRSLYISTAMAVIWVTPAFAQNVSEAVEAVEETDTQETTQKSRSLFDDNIVVTATRREENAQNVGISITAFSEEQLDVLNLETQGDIANYTPSVEFVRFWSGKGVNSVFFIRGLGQADFNEATEAPAALYVDEFYILSSGATDFLLHDAERVEVLRGPQGSLFGRNTTAGAINITNNKPTYDLGGRIVTSFGRFNRREIDGFLNVPLVEDKLAVRFSANTETADGYTTNFFDGPTGQDKIFETSFSSFRGQVLAEPNDRLRFLYKYQYGLANPSSGLGDSANPAQAVEGDVIPAPTDMFGYSRELDGLEGPYEVNIDTQGRIFNEVQIHTARIDFDVTDDIQLTMLGGYFDQTRENTEDCDGSPRTLCNVHNQTAQDYFTGEIKFTGSTDKFDWTAGAFYLDQELDNIFELLLFSGSNVAPAAGLDAPANGLLQLAQVNQTLKSYAGYLHGKYALTDKLFLSAGVRLTRDEKEIDQSEGLLVHDFTDTGLTSAIGESFGYVSPNFEVGAFDEWDDLRTNHIIGAVDPLTRFSVETAGDMALYEETYISGDIQLDYQLNDDTLIYLGFRRGVKGGGFNNGLFDITTDTYNDIPVDKEVNHDIEGGYKWGFGDGLGFINQSFFFYDYTGYQATAFVGSGNSLSTLITNNDATVFGTEVEVALAPIEGLDIRLTGAYLDTEVKDVSNRGVIADRELGRAPKFNFSGIFRYEFSAFGGYVAPQVDFSWTGERYVDVVNNTQGLLDSYGIVNASLSYTPQSERWFISAGGFNLNGSDGPVNIFEVTGAGNVGQTNFLPPRRWQVQLGIRF